VAEAASFGGQVLDGKAGSFSHELTSAALMGIMLTRRTAA
jgi:hypothetical protein